MYRRVAILGTGLIGGSFALALRRAIPGVRITGWDRPEVLERARARSVIDQAAGDVAAAVAHAELVYLALPVGAILEVLPVVAAAANPAALVTDAGSTKQAICCRAGELFRSGAAFLGGHPLAGRETGGLDSAEAELFRGARYALIGEAPPAESRAQRFAELVRAIGATPVWLEAAAHDRAVAFVSHLPQLAAVALAGVVEDETGEAGPPLALAGPGLRDALRLAGSPYDVWRDTCLTNRENLAQALTALLQALEQVRQELADPGLARHFARANRLYSSLRKLQ